MELRNSTLDPTKGVGSPCISNNNDRGECSGAFKKDYVHELILSTIDENIDSTGSVCQGNEYKVLTLPVMIGNIQSNGDHCHVSFVAVGGPRSVEGQDV